MPVCVSRGASSSSSLARSVLRDAEVDDLHEVLVLALQEEQVLRLDVAVDDALRVRGGERRRGLRGDPQDALLGQLRLAREALGERLALEELHHDERAAVVGVAEVGDVDDVLVADRRRELRLLLEARDDRFALRVLLEQHLDRDALADQRVRRLVDRAHAALADLARDEVAARQRRCRCRSLRHRSGGVPAAGVGPASVADIDVSPILQAIGDRGVVRAHRCHRHRSSARPVAAGYRPQAAPATTPAGLVARTRRHLLIARW